MIRIRCQLVTLILACAGAALLPAQSASTGAIRFFGTGSGGQDRVRIPIDDNATGNNTSSPADVGAVGFSVDFWIKGDLAANPSAARAEGSYADFNWIEGNTVVDRDIWGSGNHSERDWGISIAGGYVAFGTGRGVGPSASVSFLAGGNATDTLNTIHGGTPVLDGQWHHVAVVRDYVTGAKRIYVDGALDYEVSGVTNDDLSYPDGGVTVNASSKDNPYIVIGAEKHDAGSGYPSFNGTMDEVRVWRRALGAEEVAFLRDKVVAGHYPGLAGYWRFEEPSGTTVADSAVVGKYQNFTETPANSTGTLVNNTAGNGLRVFATANAANTPSVSSLPLPPVTLGANRVAVNGTFASRLFATHAPGQPERLYVVQQGSGGSAQIRIFELGNQTVLPTPFLSISGLNTGGEEGLLGLAFHPQYATNRAFYVYLTNNSGNNEVRRYLRNATLTDVADPGSGVTILSLPHPGQSNHNGGWIAFGPDGYLHIATGDGGGGNDPSNNAQNTGSLLGKILRIAPGTSGNATYTIPPDNPFVGVAGADEIFAVGLRNPWRCAFDRQTGEFWIGDVGQGAFEEIHRMPTGGSGAPNFGWPALEGFADNPGRANDPHPVAAVPPIADFGRTMGRSITGGYVYRGNAISGLQGTYFFADYLGATGAGNGRIHSFRYTGNAVREFTERSDELDPSPGGSSPSIRNIASFAEDAYGELYVIDLADGELFKIVSKAPWDVWRAGQFTRAELADLAISGDEADPEGDGMTNLFEYAAGRDPQVSDAAPIVEGTTEVAGKTYLTLTFNRAAVSGVTAVGQASADAGASDPWSSAGVVVVTSSPTQLTVRDTIALEDAPRRFLRIRVTRP